MKLISHIASLIALCSCASADPSPEDHRRFSNSPNYNSEKKQFENRRQEAVDKMWEKSTTWAYLKRLSSTKVEDGSPEKKLPEGSPKLEEFTSSTSGLKVIWLGHSTFLLNLDGSIILVDPVLTHSSFPFAYLFDRFQAPVLELEDLPEVDYVLISHDHSDHLDENTIRFFKDKKTRFILPLGVGNHLIKWGIPADRFVEKDWWQSHRTGGIEFIATPSQHFSGRGLFNPEVTLWASWVVRSKQHSLFFSGDTGYDTHFQQIGEKLGPFDVAFIECGQYDQKWNEIHLFPEQTAQAFQDLKAKKLFPIHWGMYQMAFHSWYEPIERLYKLSQQKGFDLLAPRLGEITSVTDSTNLETWWQNRR